MGLWADATRVYNIPGVGYDPPGTGPDPVVTSITIGSFLFYVDTNGNLNIYTPDLTVIPLVTSGMGPSLPP